MAKSTSFSQRQESLKRSVMARRSAFSEADESMQPLELYFGPKEGQIVHLELARIALAPDHPRQSNSAEAMEALTQSIRTEGLLSPILVRRQENRYVVVAGQRRLDAHQQAGFEKIRALIDASSPDQAFEHSLIENLLREDLTPLEEAAAVGELIRRRSYSQQQAGFILGRSKTHIFKLMQLNRLDKTVKDKLQTTKLGLDQLYQIALQKTAAAQMRLAEKILAAGLNTRQTRQAAGKRKKPEKYLFYVQHIKRMEQALEKDSVAKLAPKQRQELKKRLLALAEQL